jgi:hypothetical protein
MDNIQKIAGGIGCDIVTGTAEFTARMGKIYAIISNEDDSRIISYKEIPKKGDTPVTVTGRTFQSVKRVDTITITGSAGGTATIVCNGVTITGDTFASTAAATATAFVTDHAAAMLAGGVVVTQGGAGHTGDLIFTALVAGTTFTGATSCTNVSGSYSGTVVATTANVLFAINDNKMVIPDFPVSSITPGKGTFYVYYING